MRESIYMKAHRLVEKEQAHQRLLDWGIDQFIRWALPVVIDWEKRKSPEYQAVQRSLEMRS